jgi:hypothetical protein
MSSLSDVSMLISLSIKTWSGKATDKNEGRDVAARHGAHTDAITVRKTLLESDELDAIKKITNEARTYHYKNTLPWDDQNGRLLTTAHFAKYSAEMRSFKAKFQAAVNAFLAVYDAQQDAAQQVLGSLYREDEYPDPAVIEGKFGYETTIKPVPCAGDFRANVSDEERARIKKQIETQNVESLNLAMRDLWDRLYDGVARMSENLAKYNPSGKGKDKNTFHGSTVTNLVDLCDVLKNLNVTGDKKLEQLRRDVEHNLISLSADTLKKDHSARASVQRIAADIAADIAKARENTDDDTDDDDTAKGEALGSFFEDEQGGEAA